MCILCGLFSFDLCAVLNAAEKPTKKRRLKTVTSRWMELFIYHAGHFQDVALCIASLRSDVAPRACDIDSEFYFRNIFFFFELYCSFSSSLSLKTDLIL